ncbi:putative aldolase class 2 protein PA3430 [Saccoglossus kowalevskii]|uniref:Beta-adducin-like n=1 Tax=Saccoglossus kowalevskii TaxID=10224 RepID=A0ABM0GRU4_SACKO|nr:PREDICTED: beta-adducin-like [Saccoglossus kowalevskii]
MTMLIAKLSCTTGRALYRSSQALSSIGGIRIGRQFGRHETRPASGSASTREQRHGTSDAAQRNYEARVDLAAAYRGICNYGLSEGVCNHLSVNAPASNGSGRLMLLIPHGLHWKEVTASKLLGIDFATGEVLEGEGRPEKSASEIHRAVHNERPDIRCALHTHPPYTTALNLLKEPYLSCSQQHSLRFYDNIAYDSEYDGYATSGEEGPRLARALGKKRILMMGGHGLMVVSQTVSMAFDETYYMERAAMFQILAMSTGKELLEIPEEIAKRTKIEADATFQAYADAHFNSIKRLLLSESPDFMS